MFNGQKIREAREMTGLKQHDVAEKLGKTRQAISDIERGKYQPGRELVKQMAELYGVAVEDFKQDYSQPGQLPPSLTESESLILNVWNRLDESGKVKLLATGQQLISQIEADESEETPGQAVSRAVLEGRKRRQKARKDVG